MARMTRRGVLGGGVAVAAVAGIAAPQAVASSPDDAELIAIGREAADLVEQRKPLEVRWWALPRTSGRTDSPHRTELHAISYAMEPIDTRLQELADRAMQIQATSRAGFIAKAHLARHEMKVAHVSDGELDIEEFNADERLVWGLLDDLLRVPA